MTPQHHRNSCPTGPVAEFARNARRFGSITQAAGDWTAIAGLGVAALGAAGLQPEIVASGGIGVILGEAVPTVGLGVQLLAGSYLYAVGDPGPLTSTVAGQALSDVLPSALPRTDPSGNIGDSVARRADPNLQNCDG